LGAVKKRSFLAVFLGGIYPPEGGTPQNGSKNPKMSVFTVKNPFLSVFIVKMTLKNQFLSVFTVKKRFLEGFLSKLRYFFKSNREIQGRPLQKGSWDPPSGGVFFKSNRVFQGTPSPRGFDPQNEGYTPQKGVIFDPNAQMGV
jgi:hypothetical protein